MTSNTLFNKKGAFAMERISKTDYYKEIASAVNKRSVPA